MNEGRILEPYSGLLQKSVPVCLFKIAGNLSLWTIVKTWTIKFVHTDLADVILFEAEAKATSANYMLVLSANAIGKDLLELNVVFEDGTVQAIEVDDDGGHDWDDEASYMKAYTYAENADGTYDIGDDVENAGTAKLLKNGTVDSSLKGYIALSGKANV